jgi:outer membrane protein OmpA-like peptidoglycan-associated protein
MKRILTTFTIACLALLLHACATPEAQPVSAPVVTDTRAETIAELRRNAHLSVTESANGELLVRIRSTNHFRSASQRFSEEFTSIVQHIAKVLIANPALRVTVIGHTDATGREATNLQLSQQRAQAVLAQLIELGVDSRRVSHEGRGGSEPIASNDTGEGRAVNRRVDFLIRIDPVATEAPSAR